MIDRALSIKEPWAYLIAAGFKEVENRRQKFGFRGRVAIHASAGIDLLRRWHDEDDSFAEEICDLHPRIYSALDDPRTDERCIFAPGHIIGSVEILDCIDYDALTDSPRVFAPYGKVLVPRAVWAQGPHCLILADARRYRYPVPAKGKLGLWRLSDEQRAMIERAEGDLLADPGEPPYVSEEILG